jgi:hypothetical protein
MTKKRLLLFGGFLAACVCLPLGVVAMMPSSPGVTKANFDRIQEGMTKAQVQEIFGEEGRVSNLVFEIDRKKSRYWMDFRANDWSLAWIAVHPDDDEIVIEKKWQDSGETFSDKIRRWLHLP